MEETKKLQREPHQPTAQKRSQSTRKDTTEGAKKRRRTKIRRREGGAVHRGGVVAVPSVISQKESQKKDPLCPANQKGSNEIDLETAGREPEDPTSTAVETDLCDPVVP